MPRISLRISDDLQERINARHARYQAETGLELCHAQIMRALLHAGLDALEPDEDPGADSPRQRQAVHSK